MHCKFNCITVNFKITPHDKRVFNNCKTIVLSLSTVGSLVDHRAFKPYTLAGPLVWWPVLAPLAVYSSTTYYIYVTRFTYESAKSYHFSTKGGNIKISSWWQKAFTGSNQIEKIASNYLSLNWLHNLYTQCFRFLI